MLHYYFQNHLHSHHQNNKLATIEEEASSLSSSSRSVFSADHPPQRPSSYTGSILSHGSHTDRSSVAVVVGDVENAAHRRLHPERSHPSLDDCSHDLPQHCCAKSIVSSCSSNGMTTNNSVTSGFALFRRVCRPCNDACCDNPHEAAYKWMASLSMGVVSILCLLAYYWPPIALVLFILLVTLNLLLMIKWTVLVLWRRRPSARAPSPTPPMAHSVQTKKTPHEPPPQHAVVRATGSRDCSGETPAHDGEGSIMVVMDMTSMAGTATSMTTTTNSSHDRSSSPSSTSSSSSPTAPLPPSPKYD